MLALADITEQKTPLFDLEAGEFVMDARNRVVCVTGGEGVLMIAMKALKTVRGIFLIYADLDDEELDHVYGSDVELIMQEDLTEEARLSEMERAISESLIYDPWVTDVTNLVLKRRGGPGQYGENADHLAPDEVEISMTIKTIFDQDVQLEGVIIEYV